MSRAPGAADTVAKVIEGTIRNISVGYWVYACDETDGAGGVPTRTATDWEPLEVSFVAIPADPGAQVRSAGTSTLRRRAHRATPISPFEAGEAMARAAVAAPARPIGAALAGAAMARKLQARVASGSIASNERREAEAVGDLRAANGRGRTAEQEAAIDYLAGRRAAQKLLGQA